MNKVKALFNAIKRSPRLAALVAIVALTVIVPATLLAWGPDRPTYTWADPADHVTFDSITDNPAYGDERNFVRIKQADADNSTYSDNTTLVPGKEYQIYVYYHNNASSSLNASGVGIAKDVALRMELPATVKAGQSADINGYISASNATPGTVWDNSTVTATTDTALSYVPGSAVVHSLGAVNGQTLPDSVVSSGAALGYDSLNGVLPGCNDYAGYVIMDFTAVAPNFEVTKQVSLGGQKNYQASVNANVGDTVDYRVEYHNTGTVAQDNVVIKDTMPAGLTYIPGSTYVANTTTGGQYKQYNSDNIMNGGITIGDFDPDGNAYIKYSAKVDGICGTNTLINSVSANTDNGSKSATANVVVTKDCGTTPPTPSTPVTELPTTGIETGVAAFVGLGIATAAVAYAATSDRVRKMLRR